MVDTLGYRMKFGVIAPSTNTSVEPEYAAMQARGVTNHFGRIIIPDDPVRNDKDFEKLLVNIRAATTDALDAVMTCSPGYVIMGMSAETFLGRRRRGRKIEGQMEKRAKVTVSLGSHACEKALATYAKMTRKKIKRIGVLTPYMPVGDKNVRRFFTDNGFEVVTLIGRKSPSPMLIAHETPETLRKAIIQPNTSNPDAIVQVGTNLACVAVAAEAKRWLDKPVIAINAATYWYSLRDAKIMDKVPGYGRLLEHA